MSEYECSDVYKTCLHLNIRNSYTRFTQGNRNLKMIALFSNIHKAAGKFLLCSRHSTRRIQ